MRAPSFQQTGQSEILLNVGCSSYVDEMVHTFIVSQQSDAESKSMRIRELINIFVLIV